MEGCMLLQHHTTNHDVSPHPECLSWHASWRMSVYFLIKEIYSHIAPPCPNCAFLFMNKIGFVAYFLVLQPCTIWNHSFRVLLIWVMSLDFFWIYCLLKSPTKMVREGVRFQGGGYALRSLAFHGKPLLRWEIRILAGYGLMDHPYFLKWGWEFPKFWRLGFWLPPLPQPSQRRPLCVP